MENEDRSIGRDGVNLIYGRHSAFCELELAPTTHYTHPLSWRSALGLLLEHPQSIGKRRHTIPAKLQVVVQTTTDDMEMRIVKSRNRSVTTQIHDLCLWPLMRLHGYILTDG